MRRAMVTGTVNDGKQLDNGTLDKSATAASMVAVTVPPSPGTSPPSFANVSIPRKDLMWREIHYTIPIKIGRKASEKKVVDSSTGGVNAGQILAIMGPSGSGKTSLLNVIAGRVLYQKGAMLMGDVLINGKSRDEKDFKRFSAYVMQDDALYAFLTVEETIKVAAHCHLPANVSYEDKMRYVARVIQELGLSKARHTIIGNEKKRGVSGGERRRVMIAVELISNPSILFLDEPTSGLDSFQAQSVVSALKDLARAGRTIVTAIHQPRSSIFQMFDMLLLLSEGRTVYLGPSSQAVAYFSQAGFEVPPLFNPADYYLDLIAMDYRTPEAEKLTRERITMLQNHYEKTTAGQWMNQVNRAQQSSEAQEPPSKPGLTAGQSMLRYLGVTKKSSWLQQYLLLFWRSGKDSLRNTELQLAKIGISAVMGLLLGLLYSNVGHGQKSISDRKGILFFVTINQAFGLISAVCGTFPNERKIVDRERASNSYHISAYYMAKFWSELPFNLLGPLTLGSVVYFIAHLRPGIEHFLIFVGIITLESLAAIALGMVVSSVASSADVANVLQNPIGVAMLLCGGFYISISSLPKGARWVADISLMKWAFQGLVINEFAGTTLTCDENDRKCLLTGEEAIKDIGFAGCTLEGSVVGLVVLVLSLNILAYIILRYNKQRYQALVPITANK